VDIGKLYGHLVNFVAIWYILWLFGTFFPFWYVVPTKIWQPWDGEKEKSFNSLPFLRISWTLEQCDFCEYNER
jgi:hypothetical protein